MTRTLKILAFQAFVLLSAAVLLMTVAERAKAAPPPAASVEIANFTFKSQMLTVKAGTTVTWTNADDIPHTVAATGKQFRSEALDTDGKFSFTFTTPGSYEYFCSLHPHMTGVIVVEAATGSTQ